MTSRLGLRLLAAALPLTLLAPAAAHAEKVVTEDAVGDARSYTVDYSAAGEEVGPEFLLAPDETSADVVRTVVAHGAKRLSVVVHVRDLQTTRLQLAVVRVVTPDAAFTVEMQKMPGSRAEVDLTSRKDRDLRCRSVRASTDGTDDLMSVSLPTACIGGPRWVRIGVGVISSDLAVDGTEAASETLFADDAQRDSISVNSIASGPKVFRG